MKGILFLSFIMGFILLYSSRNWLGYDKIGESSIIEIAFMTLKGVFLLGFMPLISVKINADSLFDDKRDGMMMPSDLVNKAKLAGLISGIFFALFLSVTTLKGFHEGLILLPFVVLPLVSYRLIREIYKTTYRKEVLHTVKKRIEQSRKAKNKENKKGELLEKIQKRIHSIDKSNTTEEILDKTELLLFRVAMLQKYVKNLKEKDRNMIEKTIYDKINRLVEMIEKSEDKGEFNREIEKVEALLSSIQKNIDDKSVQKINNMIGL